MYFRGMGGMGQIEVTCQPTDDELARDGGRARWDSLNPQDKAMIGETICSRHPGYASILTMAQRLNWKVGVTADDLRQAAAANETVANYVREAYGGDFARAAAELAPLSKQEAIAKIESVLGYYGEPLSGGGLPVGGPYERHVPPDVTIDPDTSSSTTQSDGGGPGAGASGRASAPEIPWGWIILGGLAFLVMRK